MPTLPAGAQTKQNEVVFLRGVLGVFSRGLDDVAKRLKRDGITTSSYAHGNWQKAARKLVRSKKRKNLIIVGHSFGADAAVFLSRRLRESRKPVGLLITLDPTVKLTVPDNVERALNYYLPQSIWGKPLSRSRGSSGAVKNIELATTKDFGHYGMDDDPELKGIIEALIRIQFGADDMVAGQHRLTLRESFAAQ